MAITKAAKKAIRSSARKRVFNDRRRVVMKKAIKNFKELVSKKNLDEAKETMPQVQKAIDKAVKAGIIKKNTGARRKSRLVASLKRAGE